MAAGKHNRLVIRCAKAPDDAIGARADIRRLLAVRASVAEQEPAGPAGEDFAGLAPLVVAVIPFEQVGIDLGGVAEPGECAGAGRPLKGTGEDPIKLEPPKTLVEPSRLAFALFREGNIRASRMLAARAPFGFAMADKIDTGKHGDSNPRLRRQWGAEDGNILLRLALIWICDQWALSNVMSRREGSCSRESELLLDRGGPTPARWGALPGAKTEKSIRLGPSPGERASSPPARSGPTLACCRFRGHREKVFDEAGGGPW